ncbi:hypothetical protein C8A01DRAFT_31700 [Parachaetomium inaequale]|uniref:LYC1 C-terminal domain-containing protein n=1 Tax=Parachaetomium inaequale TaxID=2588326 RepID=A0AAN6PNK1_9PEZI|nr:hypothetical protein C8A01DRAFT_31700 [Parachaetomium inaequale]
MGSNNPPSTTTTSGAPPPSSSPPDSLPDATSPLLVLTHPTPRERTLTARHTYPTWGFALAEADYLARETYLTTVPLARDGGITHWILTLAGAAPDARPILSSCESLRKRAVYVDGGSKGEVVEGVAHGIGSVFTEPAFRGRGYASRMMRDVGAVLRGWQAAAAATNSEKGVVEKGHSLFSVLYSDIGKTFYARHGWAAFESAHVSFKPVEGPVGGGEGQVARAIGYHELAELCAVDEKLLRADLARRGGGKTHVAILPELDALLWHLMREDYMTKCIFGKTPTVRGAVAGEPGKRVWAVWMRGYYGGLKKLEGNVLHVLRVVVEDPEQPDEELVAGFRSIVQIAQHEAAEWKTQDIQVWNPTPKIRGLVEKCGIESEFVNRDKDSIASLRWYGEEPTAELDWVANEKYAWC